MLQFLRKVAPWVLAGSLFAWGWHLGSNSMDAQWKQEVYSEYVKKTEARAVTQAEVDKISQRYQEEIAALEGSTDRMLDDLRNDNKRLRVRVKNLSATTTDNSGCQFDGRAELDERDAKRILAVTQKGDAWIKALQDTIRKLQESQATK